MSDHADLLDLFKQRRRNLVDQLENDDEFDTASRLADVHLVIQAIEAVMTEPTPEKAGPRVEFGEDGWPK
jgi:hypothetical protein